MINEKINSHLNKFFPVAFAAIGSAHMSIMLLYFNFQKIAKENNNSKVKKNSLKEVLMSDELIRSCSSFKPTGVWDNTKNAQTVAIIKITTVAVSLLSSPERNVLKHKSEAKKENKITT